jgi:hypothetical protein
VALRILKKKAKNTEPTRPTLPKGADRFLRTAERVRKSRLLLLNLARPDTTHTAVGIRSTQTVSERRRIAPVGGLCCTFDERAGRASSRWPGAVSSG